MMMKCGYALILSNIYAKEIILSKEQYFQVVYLPENSRNAMSVEGLDGFKKYEIVFKNGWTGKDKNMCGRR